MASYRMLPPPAPISPTIVAGRSYFATAGNTLDVPDFDMPTLRANGWQVLGLVGTTGQRPAALPVGVSTFIDTTITTPLVFDGKDYRDKDGGKH